MNESSKNEVSMNYDDIIKRTINRSIRSENIIHVHFNEWIYYDEYNNTILQKRIYDNNSISYEVYENEYDEFGNMIISSNTKVIDNRIYSYEIKTYYEYIYDEHNRIVQKKRFFEKHRPYEMIRNYYDKDKLIKTECYKMQGVDMPDYINMQRFDFNAPYKIHNFTYENELIKEEKVCLHSGDVSYYKVYENAESEGKIINPFRTEYSWILESIFESTFEIILKEDTFNGEMLTHIVDSILSHYSSCDFILLSLSTIKNYSIDNDKINAIMEMYKKNQQIIFAYIS